MSDAIAYACGHTIAQRDITGSFDLTISGNVCPACEAWDNPTPDPVADALKARDELLKEVIASPSPSPVSPYVEMRTYISPTPIDNYVYPDMPIPTPVDLTWRDLQPLGRYERDAGHSNNNDAATFFVIMFILFILVEGGKAGTF